MTEIHKPQPFKRVLFCSLGILSATLGIEGFLQPSGFIDGGITGVSMLLSEIFHMPLFLFIFLANAPFFFVAYKRIGPRFAFRTFLTVLSFCAVLFLFDLPQITTDKLLTAVFGGMFVGAGIGMAIRGGAVLDGTEVLALVISKRGTFTVGDAILGFNIVIFGVAALILGIEPALYSILTYFSASKTVDFLIHGIEEYYAIFVLSGKVDEIRAALINDLGRSVTRFRGRSGLANHEQDIVFCVVTRIEVPNVKTLIQQIDESAFVVVHHVSDVMGGVVRQSAVDRIAA